MVNEVKKNENYYLEINITDDNGNGVSDKIIEYSIYKSLDNILIEQGLMIEIGNGIYQKSINLSETGQYRVCYKTPEKYCNSIETLIVTEKDSSDITKIIEKLDRILGLSGENKRLFDLVYDNKNNLTSATIKIYANRIDADNNVNAIATYKTTGEYNLNNDMIAMKEVKE